MGLFVVGLIFVAFLAGVLWHAQNKHTVLKYRDLNAHRITPKFNVGSDAK
jgi:hypothetical protein